MGQQNLKLDVHEVHLTGGAWTYNLEIIRRATYHDIIDHLIIAGHFSKNVAYTNKRPKVGYMS